MGIEIKQNFETKDVRALVEQRAQLIENKFIERLQYVGESFIVNARSLDTYKDRTGNLRSSIGYVILKNGLQLFSDFPGEHAEGTTNGRKVAQNVSSNFTTGLVLICVAGMEYAGYVESRGYDVITGSALQAETDIKRMVGELIKQLG